MSTNNPDFDAVEKCLLKFFYENRARFTMFENEGRWPGGFYETRNRIDKDDVICGSLEFRVRNLDGKRLEKYPDASRLVIETYLPGRSGDGFNIPEIPGSVKLYGLGHAQRLGSVIYGNTFGTCSDMQDILVHIFGPDDAEAMEIKRARNIEIKRAINMEYETKKNTIVNNIGKGVHDLIKQYLLPGDVQWMRDNNRLSRLMVDISAGIVIGEEKAFKALDIPI